MTNPDKPEAPAGDKHGLWCSCDDCVARRIAEADKDASRFFDEPGSRFGDRRRGREGRSIPHSYGGEGFNYVD
jgi:hypothetical protein